MPSPLPRTGERVDGVSWRGSPPWLARCPTLTTWRSGREAGTRRAGWQTVEALPCGCWSIGGEVWRGVVMVSPRTGRGARPSSRPGCLCDVARGWALAMVWTVGQQTEQEERRGTGEDGGGILRPGSLSSFPSACFCSFYIYNKVYLAKTRRLIK